MEVTLRVCDVDKDPTRETKRYKVSEGRREVEMDLCEEHSGPAEDLLGRGSTGSTRGRQAGSGAGRGRGRGKPVTSMEEIAALKGA